MSTKNAPKSVSKKSDAKAASATEKARKAALAAIGKRIDAAPDATDNSVNATAPVKVTKLTKLEKLQKTKKAANEKKPTKAAKPAKEKKPARISALDAAATVLAASKEPLRTKDIIEQMAAKKLWSSPNGKTPEATLHAALMREINVKKSASRFSKAGRGLFASTGKAA